MKPQKNTPTPPYAGQRVLVVGLGLHGGALGAVRWFSRQGARVRVTDTKSAVELAPTILKLRRWPITYHFGALRPADLSWADVIYQNQAVPKDLPLLLQAQRRGRPIVNEASLFFAHCPADTVIGVTGTRGKSTTTALIRHLLSTQNRRVVQTGNIRERSMLDVLPTLKSSDVVVAELSSFQLEYLRSVKRSPQVSVVTNIGVDHLNRHGTMAKYTAAKGEILRYQRPTDTAILNADNSWTRRLARLSKAQKIFFSASGGASAVIVVRGGWIIISGKKLLPIRKLKLPGRHNLENILAALAVAHTLRIRRENLIRGLASFVPLAHRLEFVRRVRGHDFINDTTATSPDGTLAALNVFPRGLFILGGADKKLDYQRLAQTLTQKKTPIVFLPGTATVTLRRLLVSAGYRARHHEATTMAAAVRSAMTLARAGQPIVLSPGAASFGLFIHEFDRGQQFIRAVNRL